MPFSFMPQTGHVPGFSYVFSCSHFIGHWYLVYFSVPQDENAIAPASATMAMRENNFMLKSVLSINNAAANAAMKMCNPVCKVV